MRTKHTNTAVAAAAVVALGAGFLLPFEAYLGLAAGVFALVVGMLVLGAQLDAPFVGVALLVVTAVVLPLEFRGPAGVMMGSSLPLAAAFCGIWLLRLPYRSVSLDPSRAVYAALAFMAVTVSSFVVGQFPIFPSGGAPLPAQVVELGLFLLSCLLFLAVGHQIGTERQLRTLTWLFLAAGTVTLALQMMPSLRSIARLTSRPGSIGSLFWTWLMAVSLAQALFNRQLSLLARTVCGLITAVTLYHGLVEARSWASGWLPGLAAIGVILLVRLPRISLGTGLVALPIGLAVGSYVSRLLIADESYSLMTRVEAWNVLWRLIERSPLLGTGLANYYYYTENMPLLGWYVRFISHNNYQDLLVQTGVLGLLAFCWFVFEAFLLMIRLHARVISPFGRAYIVGSFAGLTGSLVAGMLGDWFIPFYYNAGVLGFRSSLLLWVFLGGVLALKRMTLSSAPEAVARTVSASRATLPRPLVPAR